MNEKRQQLRDLVDAKSLKRGDFTLASGAKSKF
jgi:orotate phosphoribosyltransferase